MAVDVSKIPNNNKFDPVRQAILDLQGEISSGVAGVASINNVSGAVTLTGLSPITISSSASTSQITIGINQSLLSITESQISDLGNYLDLDNTGTQTVAGNIVIEGDLTTSGSITYINSTHLDIGDNIIKLNADITSTTAPTEDAGFYVNRGSSPDVSFLWDEQDDRFSTYASALATASLYIGSNQVINSSRQFLGSSTISSTVPYFTFSGDSNTGVGRATNNKVSLIAEGTKVLEASDTGVDITGTLDVSGSLTADGIVLTDEIITSADFSATNNRFKLTLTQADTGTIEASFDDVVLSESMAANYVPYVKVGGGDGDTTNAILNDSFLKINGSTLELDWDTGNPLTVAEHDLKMRKDGGGSGTYYQATYAADSVSFLHYASASDIDTAKVGATSTGRVRINDTYNLPAGDGTSGQVLSTNGSGDLSWVAAGGSTTSDLQDVTDNGNTTTNSISIGKSTAPNARLDVARTTNGADVAYFGGQVRIAEGDPSRLTIADKGGSANLWNFDNAGGTLRVFREDYASSGTGANGSVKLAITNAGDVGIGTSTPSVKLDVKDSSSGEFTALHLTNTFDDNNAASNPLVSMWLNAASNNGYLRLYGAPADTASKHRFDIGSTAGSSFITFSTSADEKMRIANDGKVGIGTTTPARKLQVQGSGYFTGEGSETLLLGRVSGQPTIKADASNGGYLIMDSTNNINALNWYSSQNVVIAQGGGNVLIGSPYVAPNARLHVRDNNAGGIVARMQNDANGAESAIRFQAYTTGGSARYADIALVPDTQTLTIRSPYNSVGGFDVENGGDVRIRTASGYVNIGALNTTWAHFYTDRGGYYFNEKVIVDGGTIGSYNEDLLLVRADLQSDYIRIADTYIGFYLDGNEDMRLTNSGHLGINQTNPQSKLHITNASGGSGGYLKVTDAGYNGDVRFGMADGINNDAILGVWTNNNVRAYTNGQERMRINSNGVIEINPNKNSQRSFRVYYDMEVYNSVLFTDTSYNIQSGIGGTAGALVLYSNGTSERMRITSAGNVGIGTTSPSYKLEVVGDARVSTNLTVGSAGQTNTYLYLLSSTSGTSNLRMGDTDTDAGAIIYSNASNLMTFRTNAGNRVFIDSSGNLGVNTSSPQAKLDVKGGILTRNTRVNDSQAHPVGHYNEGEQVFGIDPTWSQSELQQFFNSSNVSWNADSTAPGGYAIYINGGVNVGGVYTSGFPYIPVDQDDYFYMEVWIKNAGSGQTHYMGSNEFNENFTSLGGHPGSFGYWVMSNTNPGSSWTKVSGYIGGFSASTVGTFENGTKYWTPMALFNYGAGSGTRACYISGWKVYRVTQHGRRKFTGAVGVLGGSYSASIDSVSDAGLVVRQGRKIYSLANSDQYLRNLIEYNSANNIVIGQTGTSLIADVEIKTGSSGNFKVFTNGGETMRLASDAKLHVENDIIAFSTTVSDARLKDDVVTIDNALDKVKALRGVEYVWNKGGREGQKDLGFIAQEVEQVIPEIVRENEMPLFDDSGEQYKTVDYEKVVAVLVEAMKEQQKQIDELKARLDA